jgi:hypothetical protein
MDLGGRLHAAAVLPITESIRYPQDREHAVKNRTTKPLITRRLISNASFYSIIAKRHEKTRSIYPEDVGGSFETFVPTHQTIGCQPQSPDFSIYVPLILITKN